MVLSSRISKPADSSGKPALGQSAVQQGTIRPQSKKAAFGGFF
jgi:hypothetical protein